MLTESIITGIPDTALELHKKGLRLIPLHGKCAILKDWPNLHLGESDVLSWSKKQVNWGIITGEPLIVLDTDTEEAEAWVREKQIDSTVVVQSGGRGLHRYFRSSDGSQIRSRSALHRIKGLDVKGWHGYIVAAGSIHPKTGNPYAYLPGRELTDIQSLPFFDPSWIKEIRQEPLLKPRIADGSKRFLGHIRDVRAYIRGIASIEGQAGDKACFTVACFLAEAGFSFTEALSEITDWNQTNAFPPWETKELLRKLRYAFARVMSKG